MESNSEWAVEGELFRVAEEAGFDVVCPSHGEVWAVDDSWPYKVVIDVDLAPTSPGVRRVRYEAIDEERITVESMRLAPLSEIVASEVAVAVYFWSVFPKEAQAAYEDLSADERVRVAALYYRIGVISMLPPTQHVAEHFDVSRSTAARLVARAREAGYLGPALRTQAGEAT